MKRITVFAKPNFKPYEPGTIMVGNNPTIFRHNCNLFEQIRKGLEKHGWIEICPLEVNPQYHPTGSGIMWRYEKDGRRFCI